MKASRSLLIPLLSLASFALPFQGNAAVIITESFSSPLGGVPADWTTVIRNNAANDGAVGITAVPDADRNALRFTRAANGSSGNYSSNASGVVYYTASGSSQLSDFSAEVTLRLNAPLGNSSSVGIMLRSQSLAYQFTSTPFRGYYAALTMDGLGIYQNPTGNSTPGVLVSSLSGFSALGETDYLFRVSAQGSTLTASLWDIDGTEALASVIYTSANTSSGYFGIRSGYGNYNINAYFSDLTLTVIPEPTSMILLGVGGLAILHLRRRKNSAKI